MGNLATRRLIEAAASLEPADRALLNLWIHRGLDDERLADLTGMTTIAVTARRERILEGLSTQLQAPPGEVLAALQTLEPDTAPEGDAGDAGRPDVTATASDGGLQTPATVSSTGLAAPAPEVEPDAHGGKAQAEPESDAAMATSAAADGAAPSGASPDPAEPAAPDDRASAAAAASASASAPAAAAAAVHHRRGRIWAGLTVAIAVVVAVVLVVLLAGSSSHNASKPGPPATATVADSPTAPTPGTAAPTTASAPAPASSTSSTTASSATNTSAAPTPSSGHRSHRQALAGLPGGPRHLSGVIRLVGKVGHLKLRLTVKGLPKARHGYYAAWLFNSVIDSQRLGRVTRDQPNTYRLPRGARHFDFIDISLQPKGSTGHSGESKLRAVNPVDGPETIIHKARARKPQRLHRTTAAQRRAAEARAKRRRSGTKVAGTKTRHRHRHHTQRRRGSRSRKARTSK